MLGRVFENRYSSGVEYYVTFWSGMEWNIKILEYYSSIWSILRSLVAGVSVAVKKSIFRNFSENGQKIKEKTVLL